MTDGSPPDDREKPDDREDPKIVKERERRRDVQPSFPPVLFRGG
jgi:hypothetical protein